MKNVFSILALVLTVTIAKSQGDSCANAIPMPNVPNSLISNFVMFGTQKWFMFIPQTSEVEIRLVNTSPATGHVHDLLLMEGLCGTMLYAIEHDFDSNIPLKIKMHDVMVGVPYFIVALRDRNGCPKCSTPSTVFDLSASSLTPPVYTENNGIIYLDGQPSHVKNEVIIRISQANLKMNSVDNLGQDDKPMTYFVYPAAIQTMANKILNGDNIGLGQLKLRRVYPTLSSTDVTSVSRDDQNVNIPAFWETFILTIPDTLKIFKTSRILSAISGVRYAQPNYVNINTSIPNDAAYPAQASLHPTITYPNANINVQPAWDISTGQSFVKIGVFDSGIEQTHSDLSGRVSGGFNFKTNQGLSSPYDQIGHGTSCAGIVGAKRNNAIGVAGIAGGDWSGNTTPGCSLFDMKVADTVYASTNIAANAITQGALSNNFALHAYSYSLKTNVYNYTLHDATQFAAQNGVVFCASRGNYPEPGAAIDDWRYPSCFPDEMIMNIGASGSNGNWKDNTNGNPSDPTDANFFSMTARAIDFVAPGTNLLVQTTKIGNGYTGFDGTSAAVPHVAGVSGLMLSHVDQPNPSSSNLVVEDVEQILQRTATDENMSGYDDFTGWGLINAGAAMAAIKQPLYKIQHFAVNQNASSSINQTTLVAGATFALARNFGGLAAGYYIGDIVQCIITLNYNLSGPNDQIIASWPRFSSTIGWNLSNPILPDNWCEILSVSPTQAVLRTYRYNFKAFGNGELITDPILPSINVKAGLSIYTINSALAGLHEINPDGSSFIGIYPNPASTSANIRISLPQEQTISLELYDINGKLIKNMASVQASEGISTYSVSLNDVADGMYYVKFNSGSASCGKKLIVMKR